MEARNMPVSNLFVRTTQSCFCHLVLLTDPPAVHKPKETSDFERKKVANKVDRRKGPAINCMTCKSRQGWGWETTWWARVNLFALNCSHTEQIKMQKKTVGQLMCNSINLANIAKMENAIKTKQWNKIWMRVTYLYDDDDDGQQQMCVVVQWTTEQQISIQRSVNKTRRMADRRVKLEKSWSKRMEIM